LERNPEVHTGSDELTLGTLDSQIYLGQLRVQKLGGRRELLEHVLLPTVRVQTNIIDDDSLVYGRVHG